MPPQARLLAVSKGQPAARLREAVALGLRSFGESRLQEAQAKQAELFNRHQNDLIKAAKAHAEVIMWEAFTSALKTIKDADSLKILTWLRDLYGFTLLEDNLDWYLINGRLSAARAEAITEYIDTRLLPRLKPHAESLVDAFELSPGLVRTTLAQDEAARQASRKNLVRN